MTNRRPRTVNDSSGPRPCTASARATNSRQNQPRHQRRMQCTPEEPPGLKMRGHPMLKRPHLMTSAPKPQNKGHTTAECWEMRKALHKMMDKGQIGHFLKRGPRFLREEHELMRPKPSDEECSTKIVGTIAGAYAEGITRSAWKVLTAEQSSRITVPTMVFGGEERPRFTS
ncbi:hypothetical protein Cgig2_021906 [Carnegiea gigantea]|uniref:Uncharacterized protein n=1 Tax=Carnegiea gigantea TaxID=171969 RepID=A0A9Q1Q809_9CARY|nr:hypothetical protein Cgig2_021906 [Carnegiea gigantea]